MCEVGESFRRQNAGLFIMLKYLAGGFTCPISSYILCWCILVL